MLESFCTVRSGAGMTHGNFQEDAVGNLSVALAGLAGGFLRCRDETAVLELAGTSLCSHGVWIGFLVPDGDRDGAPDRDGRLRAETFFGGSRKELVLARGELPEIEGIFEAVGPVELPDTSSVAPLWEATAGWDVPTRGMALAVGGEPFGVLLVRSRLRFPTVDPLLSTFCSQVAAALENVSDHRQAAARLDEISREQEELLARERLAALSGAAGLVAHEVRNPLGAILNAATLLKRNVEQGSTLDLLEMIEEEALRIEGLVRDLLELGKPLEPGRAPVSLRSVVEEAINASRNGRNR